jgi:hypothetical protein
VKKIERRLVPEESLYLARRRRRQGGWDNN